MAFTASLASPSRLEYGRLASRSARSAREEVQKGKPESEETAAGGRDWTGDRAMLRPDGRERNVTLESDPVAAPEDKEAPAEDHQSTAQDEDD
jgi:hypothetical protein